MDINSSALLCHSSSVGTSVGLEHGHHHGFVIHHSEIARAPLGVTLEHETLEYNVNISKNLIKRHQPNTTLNNRKLISPQYPISAPPRSCITKAPTCAPFICVVVVVAPHISRKVVVIPEW